MFIKTNGLRGENKLIYDTNKVLTFFLSTKHRMLTYFVENDVDRIYGKIVVKDKNVSCWSSEKAEHDQLIGYVGKYIISL